MSDELRRLAQLAWQWGVRCFGEDHMHDRGVRSLRLAEEAIEAAQACDVTKEKMHQLVDMVYARPHGGLRQELGGVLVTTAVLAFGHLGEPIDDIFFDEIARCLELPPEHFTERNKEKLRLNLD